MNRHVNAIAGRLSLRSPQRQSLEILDRVTELVPPRKGADIEAALAAIRSEFPTVTDFEREFPSLCFALATGVGKTRLMGAFISYLYLAHGLSNFFVMAPNLTIYKKLIADFTPNTAKYVFKGISEFAIDTPLLITGDNYESGLGVKHGWLPGIDNGVRINIFNISKINSEVRGGKSPRIKRLSEYIGQSYFDYLASLPDLVLIMDESHRYRASAGVRAINELKPVLGLELTATPFVETARGAVPFKNVIIDYPLGKAMEDGFVKEPAVVTRKDFNPAGMSHEELERIKLEDGIRLHESVKVELETYARETSNKIVKPFLLVIARDTTHAGQLVQLVKSDSFFEGRYSEKVIQVDSSKTGAEEDEMVERLLKVENTDEPTEIVIHVNMLKEGWDVTNLYTIVPLRAANARILIEQSIGRGLRLPYGKRTGVAAVDRLNIVAHDKFQEIIDEASRPESTIRLQKLILDPAQLQQKTVTVVSAPNLETKLGLQPAQTTTTTQVATTHETPLFKTPEEQKVAQIAHQVLKRFESDPKRVPSSSHLQQAEIQAEVAKEVARQCRPAQLDLGITKELDISEIVAKTTELHIQQTIDIPRIQVLPKTEMRVGFKPFTLDTRSLNYQAPSQALFLQELRTKQNETLDLDNFDLHEERPEDYVVSGLLDFDDVSYDENADILYDLAGQVVRHFSSYMDDEGMRRVLRLRQREIARFVHAQMQDHSWEESVEFEVTVSKGFTELKQCAFTSAAGQAPLDYRQSPSDKSNMARYIFTGFKRCLYSALKFDSDSERKLAVILEREADKWFKPAKGQFQIYYRAGNDSLEYVPDFVAETDDAIFLLEPKARNEMTSPDVLSKKNAAVLWCSRATDHSKSYGGKPWKYVLIPHDKIEENRALSTLAKEYGC